ncbi:MAG: glycosyltransferase family 2 protein [Burkholderiales bacterium]|nr:glycosyltransferase family 2 protein [Burkholderiales bacterium]
MIHASTSTADLAVSPFRDIWDWLIVAAIFSGIGILGYAAFSAPLFDHWVDMAGEGRWLDLLLRPTILWVSMGLLLLAFRTTLWLRYRPFPSATAADAPLLTVIIPAYNEGRMVEKSIDSVARADYPAGRLQIIAVDDGSRDDTWAWIERAAGRHPGLVTTVRFPRNRGKRAALAEGFRRARGEVMVTIDSDSVIERGTLLAIAGPFRDPRVGAVAGKVAVYNRYESLLPRMLHVRFTLSFDFLRSAQSTHGTVYCCPGALAAYRATVVREVMGRWENQCFLGVQCTFGEDRALTNFILAAGHDSVYQKTAVVHTVVPTTYNRLCRMYLRWDRSYVREELRFARIVWKRPPLARAITFFDTTITNLRFPVAYTSLGLFVAYSIHDPTTLLRMLIGIGVVSTFYMLYFVKSERSWDFVYGVLYSYFSFFTLLWIFPYAALTVRARSWLTR